MICWSLVGNNIMALDVDTSDRYVSEDADVVDEVTRDAKLLAASVGMVEIHGVHVEDGVTICDDVLLDEVWP